MSFEYTTENISTNFLTEFGGLQELDILLRAEFAPFIPALDTSFSSVIENIPTHFFTEFEANAAIFIAPQQTT